MTTYSQLLFNICHEVLRTVKRGRPTKVLPKDLVVRLKNKSSKRRDSAGKLVVCQAKDCEFEGKWRGYSLPQQIS